MFNKKVITVFLSVFMLMASLICINTTVNATGANGWVYSNATWYYYNNGEIVKNGWKLDSHGWCFLNAIDGSWVQEGWAKDSVGWGYIQNGYWVQHSTWAKDSNGWLHIGDNGYWDGKPAVSTIPTENTTIAAPTGLTATAVSSSQIQLRWNNVENVDYYYVYYSESLYGDYSAVINDNGTNEIHGSLFTFYNIPENKTVYFKITAFKNGIESATSNIVSATTLISTRFFPQLSDVPMPIDASYYNSVLSSDGTTVSYYYSNLSLPSNFKSDYFTLLENNGWVFSKNDISFEGKPYWIFVKGSQLILIGFDDSYVIIMGDIH